MKKGLKQALALTMVLGLSTSFITSQVSAKEVFGVQWDENYQWGDKEYNGRTVTPRETQTIVTPSQDTGSIDEAQSDPVEFGAPVDFGVYEAKVNEYLANVTARAITDVRLSGKFANFKVAFARNIAIQRQFLDRVLDQEQKGFLTELVVNVQSRISAQINSPQSKALFNDNNFLVFKNQNQNVYSLIQSRIINKQVYVSVTDMGMPIQGKYIIKFPAYSTDMKKKTINFVYNKKKQVLPYVLVNDIIPQSKYVKLSDLQKAFGIKVQVNKYNNKEYTILSK